jgi:hypothetical protein
MLSLEPQVSKNTEPDGSETEMPPRSKIQPQQARYIVPTSFVGNDTQCLLRDAPNPPNLSREKCIEKSTLIVPKLELVKQAGKQYAETGGIDENCLRRYARR